MTERVLMPVMEGKVIKSMIKSKHAAGDKFTSLLVILFTDGTAMEIASVNFSDGSSGLALDQYEA